MSQPASQYVVAHELVKKINLVLFELVSIMLYVRLYFYLIADVFKAGSWSVLKELDDPNLRKLTDTLPEME